MPQNVTIPTFDWIGAQSRNKFTRNFMQIGSEIGPHSHGLLRKWHAKTGSNLGPNPKFSSNSGTNISPHVSQTTPSNSNVFGTLKDGKADTENRPIHYEPHQYSRCLSQNCHNLTCLDKAEGTAIAQYSCGLQQHCYNVTCFKSGTFCVTNPHAKLTGLRIFEVISPLANLPHFNMLLCHSRTCRHWDNAVTILHAKIAAILGRIRGACEANAMRRIASSTLLPRLLSPTFTVSKVPMSPLPMKLVSRLVFGPW